MNTIKRLIRPEQIRELTLFLLIVAALLFFGSQIDGFFGGRTFVRISTSVAIIAVVAVGQTLVVLTRNIDLSVGSIVGFTAYFAGTIIANNKEIAPLAAILLAVVMGAGFGMINGWLVAYGKVPAIIVTLGTLALFRGVLVEASGAKTVTTASLPAWIVDLPRATLFTLGDIDIRVIVGVAIAIVIIFQLVLAFLPYGRRLYAIGSNPDAARIAGLPARRIVFTAYVLCGALAGLAGFLFLARFGTVTVVAAQGLELQVVAAVVVGGVNVFGGSGSMIGAMLGAVLIATLEYSLTRLQVVRVLFFDIKVTEFWKDALLGLFILFAVTADAVLLNRLRNLWARSSLQMTNDQTNDPAAVAVASATTVPNAGGPNHAA